jgi:hypothetical protein
MDLQDRTPPSWDPADHLRTSYDYYRPLAMGHLIVLLREFFQIHHSYAPLFHLITAGFFRSSEPPGYPELEPTFWR